VSARHNFRVYQLYCRQTEYFPPTVWSVQLLQTKGKHYDLNDLNRALRQAAYVSDIEVMKLLIGTQRTSVNACSPKTKQTALDFALKSKSKSDMKDSCIQLLVQNGAQVIQTETVLKSSMRVKPPGY
jgi:hypothetical protein